MKQRKLKISEPHFSRKMKQAQMQMGENVAVLFIFFILLIISIVFYAGLTETKIDIKQGEAFAAKAIEIAQRISYMPEAQCSKDNVIDANCYDIHKLRALAEINKNGTNRVHYYNKFRYANITINQIFPGDGGSINIYNNPKEDYLEKSQIQIPASVCDYTVRPEKCFFSIMIVDVFR